MYAIRSYYAEGRPVSIQAAEPVIFRYKDLFVALFDLSVQPGKQTIPVGTRKFVITSYSIHYTKLYELNAVYLTNNSYSVRDFA